MEQENETPEYFLEIYDIVYNISLNSATMMSSKDKAIKDILIKLKQNNLYEPIHIFSAGQIIEILDNEPAFELAVKIKREKIKEKN